VVSQAREHCAVTGHPPPSLRGEAEQLDPRVEAMERAISGKIEIHDR